jgi:exodeoxyribonuclease VII small subunit
MTQPAIPFEKAYERLEQILEKMNKGNVPLEEALKLYEEADELLRICHEKLTNAEQKIEILIRQRNGDLSTDEQGLPLKQLFQPGMVR